MTYLNMDDVDDSLLGSQGILCVHSYVYVTTTITLTYVHKWNCYQLSGYEPVNRVSGYQGVTV